jgi:hypothetical protein
MTKRIDAKSVAFIGRRVLFDTNIWLFLNGYSNEAKNRTDVYSEAYRRLLENENTIVVNDYILGEYCNRTCKIEYELLRKASDDPDSFPSFKRYRSTSEFAPVMGSVRDTCLNMIDDCEFLPISQKHYKIADILNSIFRCCPRLCRSDYGQLLRIGRRRSNNG